MSDEVDFGISFGDDIIPETENREKELESALDSIYTLIEPLLNKLMVSPEKTRIEWPQRASVASDLHKKVSDIYNAVRAQR